MSCKCKWTYIRPARRTQQQRAQAAKEARMGEKDDAREVVKSMLLKTMHNVLGRRKRRPNFRGCFFEGSERIDPSSTNPTPAGTAGERTALKVALGGGGTQVNYIYRGDPPFTSILYGIQALLVYDIENSWRRGRPEDDRARVPEWETTKRYEAQMVAQRRFHRLLRQAEQLVRRRLARMGAAWMREMASVI